MNKIVFLICVFLCGCSANYSEGFRTGTIRKFSKKGVVIKSYEGELLLGGVISTGGKDATLVNETWEFSIDPDKRHNEKTEEIIDQLNHAVENGNRVKVYYNQDTLLKIRTETSYMIYRVEAIK